MNIKRSIIAFLALSILTTVSCKKKAEEEVITGPTVPAVFTTGQAASFVLGQPDFVTSTAALTDSGMTAPNGVTLSAAGVLYVSEQNNSRVIGFDAASIANGASATTVLGQSIFTFPGTGAAANEMSTPQAVSSSGSQVFVADWGNHRIQIFNTVTTGASSAVAVGQANTTSGVDPAGGVTATTLRYPYDVSAGGSKLAIADSSFNRVTLYNSIPSSSGASASVVVGQADKTSSASAAAKMDSPRGVWTDGTKLLVADTNNNRVLIWNSWPTADGQAADLVLGQTVIGGNTSNNGGVSASALSHPEGVTSNGTEVFVTDAGNNRILYWKTWPTANKQDADMVLGQPDFTTVSNGTTSSTLKSPTRLYFDGTKLYAADTGNNRVLVFVKQ